MSAVRLAAEVLVFAGVVVAVAASLGAVLARDALGRMHFVTPVTSVSGPLIGTGLALASGWHLATATILGTVLVMLATGPALAAATGRVAAERAGLAPPESPE